MKKTYILENLCCANCGNKIERKVNKLNNINSATLNFMTQKLLVEFKDETKQIETEKDICQIINKIDKHINIAK